MSEVYTYSPEEYSVVVGGFRMSGFADGTFVSVAADEQRYNKHVGADGKVSRARTANRAGSITITLAQTSPSNDILSAFMLADETADAGVVPIFIKDAKGTTLHFAASAWVQRVPNDDRGKTISDTVWVLDCGAIQTFLGGNNSQRGS